MNQTPEQKTRIRNLVDALRSGKYPQGYGSLAVIRGGIAVYCCLGVACEVASADGVDVWKVRVGSQISYNATEAYLPAAVMNFYGFNERNPMLDVPPQMQQYGPVVSATQANDSCLMNFSQIADCFEYTYLQERPPR